MNEQARGRLGNDGVVTYWPDHFAPLTWFKCIAPGCTNRVDPWEHNTRCAEHRPAPDEQPAVSRHVAVP